MGIKQFYFLMIGMTLSILMTVLMYLKLINLRYKTPPQYVDTEGVFL